MKLQQGGSVPRGEQGRTTDSAADVTPPVPSVPLVPGYEILGELGQGGMAVVFRARQTRANRLVALKMIRDGQLPSSDALKRFRTEGEAIARLQHPGIVQIFEVGEHQGSPYFSLELCSGGSLDRYLDGEPVPFMEVAELVACLAEAIDAAHKASIIHRDLKPANVLLVPRSDVTSGDQVEARRSLSDFVAKVSDFGLAKKLDDVAKTQTGVIMGTPVYMSPEQARGQKDLGPLSDVYALGVILYECLVGKPPFLGITSAEILLQVTQVTPASPRQLLPTVPLDLSTICMKCLRKEPEERYAMASDLAEDLKRFLAGKPILARPVSLWERGIKWVKRKPASTALIVVSLFAVVVFIGMHSFFSNLLSTERGEKRQAESEAKRRAREAELAEQRAEEEKRYLVDLQEYGRKLSVAQSKWKENKVAEARELLASAQKRLRGWEYHYLLHQFYQAGRLFTVEEDIPVNVVAFSEDGKRVVGASRREVLVRDGSTGREVRRIDLKGQWFFLSLSRSGNRLATGDRKYKPRVWDVEKGTVLFELARKGFHVALSPDGKLLAVNCDPEIEIWDVDQKERKWTIKEPSGNLLAFSYDNRFLATGTIGAHKEIRVWDVERQQMAFQMKGSAPVSFSPDNRFLVGSDGSRNLAIWKMPEKGKDVELETKLGSFSRVGFAQWSRDGGRITFCTNREEMIVWDRREKRALLTLRGQPFYWNAPSISPDGGRLVSGGNGITVWDLRQDIKGRALKAPKGKPKQPPPRVIVGSPSDRYTGARFSPDGNYVALAVRPFGSPNQISVLDLRTQREVVRSDGNAVTFHSDGRSVAIAGMDGAIRIIQVQTGDETGKLVGHSKPAFALEISPDGKFLVSGGLDRTVRVWDLETYQEVSQYKGTANIVGISLHPSRAVVGIGDSDRTVRIWNWQERRTVWKQAQEGYIQCLSFSPNGLILATGRGDNTVTIRDASSGEEARPFPPAAGAVTAIAFSPDGKRLALGLAVWPDPGPKLANSDRGEVQIWDVRTGLKLYTFSNLHRSISQISFSNDGRRLGAAHLHSVTLWETSKEPDS